MFILVRRINGATEILTKSNSDLAKTFPDSQSAESFAQKLNSSIQPNKQWKVEAAKEAVTE
ncbi:hypothetical protein ACFOGI_06020 [Virgibacillus xinjiangensis]|uniref:Uncharacterized protein n=1 Tax=Virgibacillus xinjiangensis TaxID=393090 RepID=A0ABV7CTL5_9BACI